MSAVTFSSVTKRYKDGPKAVDSLDLEIADGEFMVFVGPSGCGKSTALRMLAGLEEITGGELSIDGIVVNDLPPGDRDIAMVFQNYALYPHMTVRENIGFALEVAKVPKAEAKRRVERRGRDAGAHRVPRSAAEGAVGRPAPAGRHGPGDRPVAEGVPDGRAAVEPRRQAAGADALRHHPVAGPARYDDGVRHPRPGRGDDHGSPRGRAPQRGACSRSLPPQELYLRPANLFVASFIGSPSMNLLRGQVAVDDGTVSVSFAEHRLVLAPGAVERYPGSAGALGHRGDRRDPTRALRHGG